MSGNSEDFLWLDTLNHITVDLESFNLILLVKVELTQAGNPSQHQLL